MTERSLSALVVDHMPDHYPIARMLEQHCGATVLQVRDGVEALMALRTMRPHVVIADLNMAPFDGMDLIQMIRNGDDAHLDPTMPFIVMSGVHTEQSVMNAHSAGADTYLVKPTSLDRLAQTVRKLISEPRRFHFDGRHLKRLHGKDAMSAVPHVRIRGCTRDLLHLLGRPPYVLETEPFLHAAH